MYFQIIWAVLRRPVQRALEELVMVRQAEGNIEYPPFVQRIFEQGEVKGKQEGKQEGLREALLRLLARAGIAISEDDRARIEACSDPATLDRWIENVIGARTAAEVLR